jgi:hypothetical protein
MNASLMNFPLPEDTTEIHLLPPETLPEAIAASLSGFDDVPTHAFRKGAHGCDLNECPASTASAHQGQIRFVRFPRYGCRS